MSIFKLPDLGEGLQDAEIVEWLVKVGDEVKLDQPFIAVETAKAIVEIPSPQAGKIFKLYGEAQDIINVGDPLVEFEGAEEKTASVAEVKKEDTGTVVGEMQVGKEVSNEKATSVGQSSGGVKATPAVRALAKRFDIDLSVVTPSGPKGTVTAADVQRVAKIFEEIGPLEHLRGVRRAMAHTMTMAHAEVVPVTIYDDADIDAWKQGGDITIRVIRAITVACKAEPSLNAWYDSHAVGRRVLDKIHLGIAVDTGEGLFVPVLRDVSNRTPEQLREGLNKMKSDVQERKIPPEELRGYTFTLSNFGVFGGRYANPIIVPPTVSILGTGRIQQEIVAVDSNPVAHYILPLSLTFDHRAVIGGEATRFMAVVRADLEKPE